MKQEQLRILKIISEASSRMNLNTFAAAVNLTPTEAMAAMQELAREGFLHTVGGGYGLTEKGKNAIKLTVTYPNEKAFSFYVNVDKSLGLSAHSLEEFYRQIRQVYCDSLDFHLYRGDFENWIEQVLGDSVLASEVGALKTAGIHGEDLRKALLKAIDARYGVGELL